MRPLIRAVLITLSALAGGQVSLRAQGSFEAFRWADGDLALVYPANWEEPTTISSGVPEGALKLELAQTLAGEGDVRPPGIPFLSVTVFSGQSGPGELNALLEAELKASAIIAETGHPTALLGFDAVEAFGRSDDGTLFGIARGVWWPPDRILLVVGRGPLAQEATLSEMFDTVMNSITAGAASEPMKPTYGVLWHTLRTPADGERAFISPVGLAIGPDGLLYTVDPVVGVIALEATSGTVIGTYPNPAITAPTDLAIEPDGTVLVSDVGCGCILRLNPDGEWIEPLDEFGGGAPLSLAVGSDGTLYATDQTEDAIEVREFGNEGSIRVRFGSEAVTQPLIAVDPGGTLIALTVDDQLMMLDPGADGFRTGPRLDLAPALAADLAVDPSGRLIVATDSQGVVIFGRDGTEHERLGRVVATAPLAGEVVSPRSALMTSDGTLVVVDSDGTFGAITALSTRVGEGRIGASTLIPGVVVQGALNGVTPTQDWTLSGRAGQWVTISAADASAQGLLDPAIRLIAPDGSEEASNDDQERPNQPNPLDAQIADHRLKQDGRYTVRVERTEGSGAYRLGVSGELMLDLNPDGVTRVSGQLEAALPIQRWTFQGSAGETLTFTLQAESGTLDPTLRLMGPDGAVIEENDDAADSALGKGAQLAGVRLEQEGTYTLEAGRFDGEGEYSLVIVSTNG